MQSSASTFSRPLPAQLLRDLGRVISRGWDQIGVAFVVCWLTGVTLASMSETDTLVFNAVLIGARLLLNAYVCLFTFCILTGQQCPGIFDRLALVHPSGFIWQIGFIVASLLGGLVAAGLPWLMVMSGFGLVLCVAVCENPRQLEGLGRSLYLARGHRWWLSLWMIPFLVPGWALARWVIDPALQVAPLYGLEWLLAVTSFIALDVAAAVGLTIGYFRIRRARGELTADASSEGDLGSYDPARLSAAAALAGSADFATLRPEVQPEAPSFQREYSSLEESEEDAFQREYFSQPPKENRFEGPVGGDSVVGLSGDEQFYREYFDEQIQSGVLKQNTRPYEHPWVWTAEALGSLDRDRNRD